MRQTATRLQLSAHRFHARRMRHALVCSDVRMLDDPLRGQALALLVGVVVSVVVVAGTALFALLRPSGPLDDAAIIIARESGALYVRVGDTLHPVPNLASARLVAGTAAGPKTVSAARIAGAKRGPAVGIAGAPAAIGAPLGADESGWSVCDGGQGQTTVATGPAQPTVDTAAQVLATARSGSVRAYLIYDGRRAEVDLRQPAVVHALHLEGVAPLPVSSVLLDALPEAPAITAPDVPAAGRPGPAGLGVPVGTVARVVLAGGVQYYVVLSNGVQRVGEVAADLLRLAGDQPARHMPTLAPAAVAGVPAVDVLPVDGFPDTAHPVDAAGRSVCALWRAGPGAARTAAGVTEPGPDHGSALTLAQADGPGPHLDRVLVPGGRSAYLRAVAVDGTGPAGGPLYLLDDTGVLFGVHDGRCAQLLGLGSDPVPAPWPLLAQLPRGPELSDQAASVVRDALTPTP